MSSGKIIVGSDESKTSARQSRVDVGAAWAAAGIFSLIFLAIGIVDLALALAQSRLGDEASRFGVLGAAAGGLPLLGLGVVGLQVAAMGGGRRLLSWIATALGGLLTLACLAGLAFFLGAKGAAFAGAPVESQPALSNIVLRGTVSYTLFALLFMVVVWSGLRAFRRDRTT